MSVQGVLILLTCISYALSYSGEYVPKSYYVIDHDGHKSEVTYFRSKRDIELFPLLRMRRSGGSASSQSSAKASASSGSNGGYGGQGGEPLYHGGSDYNPGIVDPGFDPSFFGQLSQFAGPGAGGGSGSGAYSHSFASSSSSSSSGGVPHGGGGGYGRSGGLGGTDTLGYKGPILFSRFGEDIGSGVKVSGNAAGPRGAFSSSSSSIDSDGKIHYSVKSGKY